MLNYIILLWILKQLLLFKLYGGDCSAAWKWLEYNVSIMYRMIFKCLLYLRQWCVYYFLFNSVIYKLLASKNEAVRVQTLKILGYFLKNLQPKWVKTLQTVLCPCFPLLMRYFTFIFHSICWPL